MPSSYNKQLTDVNEAIKLMKFPLHKIEVSKTGDWKYNPIKDWKEVFKGFGLEYMQKDIFIDMHPFYPSDKKNINLLMGKSEDILLYRITKDKKKFKLNQMEERTISYDTMRIIYIKRKKRNEDVR